MTAGRTILFFILTIAGGVGWVAFDDRFGMSAAPAPDRTNLTPTPTLADALSAKFKLCSGAVRADCVVDGDTFWFRGKKIRIADIDAPEISEPQCLGERRAGEIARDRLLAMLNEGGFSMTAGWRDEDRYGRKLRVVSRAGRSLGDRLADQGLARRWNGSDFVWCGNADATIGAQR